MTDQELAEEAINRMNDGAKTIRVNINSLLLDCDIEPYGSGTYKIEWCDGEPMSQDEVTKVFALNHNDVVEKLGGYPQWLPTKKKGKK